MKKSRLKKKSNHSACKLHSSNYAENILMKHFIHFQFYKFEGKNDIWIAEKSEKINTNVDGQLKEPNAFLTKRFKHHL